MSPVIRYLHLVLRTNNTDDLWLNRIVSICTYPATGVLFRLRHITFYTCSAKHEKIRARENTTNIITTHDEQKSKGVIV